MLHLSARMEVVSNYYDERDTMLRKTLEYTQAEKTAYDRGYARGANDLYEGFINEAPLSGEWAGESIPELLGDLLDTYEDGESNEDDLCVAYEAGYQKAQESL